MLRIVDNLQLADAYAGVLCRRDGTETTPEQLLRSWRSRKGSCPLAECTGCGARVRFLVETESLGFLARLCADCLAEGLLLLKENTVAV